MSLIGKNIKKLREFHNIKQCDLAAKLNIGKSTLCQYESGVRIPGDDIKIAIANIFNVSVDYLLGNEQSDTTPINVFDFAMSELGKNHEVYNHFIELYQQGTVFLGQAQAVFMKNALIHDKIFFNCKESFTLYDLFEAYAYIYNKKVPADSVWSSSWYRIEYIKIPPNIISVRKNEGEHSLIIMNARAFPLPKSQKDAELMAFGGPPLQYTKAKMIAGDDVDAETVTQGSYDERAALAEELNREE